MAIQMRRGLKQDFDPMKMLPGEWAVSIDPETENQIVWMAFAAGVVKRMGTYDDFREQIREITGDILEYFNTELTETQEALQNKTELYIQGKVDEEWLPALQALVDEAAKSEASAAQSKTDAAKSEAAAMESQLAAQDAENKAEAAAEAAAKSEETAKEYSGKPPIVQEGAGGFRTWWTWNAELQVYEDTGEIAVSNVYFATFRIDEEMGELYMYYDKNYEGPDFELRDGTDLEVVLYA